ncbi:MAG: hypothetical protein LBQ84_05855 [Flavobacteriaceae bacterium]|jgi:hypothetical protein|nr:hypothetical protein [Flavobacteriaceae bacterium]
MMLDTGGLGDNITMELCKNGTVLFPSFEYSNVTVSTSTGNLNFRIKMYNNEKIKGIVNWNTGIILLPDVEREYMILDYKKDKIVLEDMDGEELIFYRPIGRVLSDDSY